MATMTNELASRHCRPCEGGVPALRGQQLADLLSKLQGWQVIEEAKITKTFKFRDFRTALAFVNRVGEVAEAENHHPEITFTWGRVKIDLSTHSILGLSENDFILAAKIDELTK